MCLRFVFLLFTRMASWLRLSRREETWRAAGLDRASEADTIDFCEGLFADELAGHSLIANRSIWRSFPTIRNERWRHAGLPSIFQNAP